MITLNNNAFAKLCYRYRSIETLQRDLQGFADSEDCKTWNLTPQQWREQVRRALKAKMAHSAA